MNSRRVSTAFAIALAAGLTPAALASAQSTVAPITVHAPPLPGVEVKDEVVKVSDLDLKNEAGVETLIGRIRGAAGRVCMPQPTHPANFTDVSDYEKCKATAMDGAVKDSGSPLAMQVLKRTGD